MGRCYYCPRWHTSVAAERECAIGKLRLILRYFESELKAVQVLLAVKTKQYDELQKQIQELRSKWLYEL